MSSPNLHIGLVQFDILWEKPDANIHRIEQLLNSQEKLDLFLLPEMWSTGFTMRPENVAETLNGTAHQWMIQQAIKMNTPIAGSISVKEGSQYYNRWYCAYPDGKLTQYDKKHLFSYGKEHLHYTPGHSKAIFEINGWRIMPIICYDLRFPVWCRNTDSYDLMVVVANWPTPRIHHWDSLLKARAIENQSYVAAVNRIGEDGNGLAFNGHSSIYDMNGQQLLNLGEKEEVGTLILNKEILTSYREQYRFLQDRDPFSI